jgi:hypothetical protein
MVKIEIESLQDMTDRHVRLGWQCPECYGVQIEPRLDCIGRPHGFQCQECGCQWLPEDR